MKLLIITQKIDINDDILGFMPGWVAEFAGRCEAITVVALNVGEHHLPANVKVLSLGKEGGRGSGFLKKIGYILRFFRYSWDERKNYDSVFVHMNQEYVILGGWLWRLLGKRVALWRNHPFGGWRAGIAAFWADDIFCTSKFAFVTKYKKTRLMPVGIDTDFFKPDNSAIRTPASILFFSRISPIKKPDVLIDALDLLNKEGIDFNAKIIGDAPERDKKYLEDIKWKAQECGLGGKVEFKKGVPFRESPAIYNQNEIFVNLTPGGSFDKVILEALACGVMALASNKNLADILSKEQAELMIFNEGQANDLAEKIKNLLKLSREQREAILGPVRETVINRHSLKVLAAKLFEAISE